MYMFKAPTLFFSHFVKCLTRDKKNEGRILLLIPSTLLTNPFLAGWADWTASVVVVVRGNYSKISAIATAAIERIKHVRVRVLYTYVGTHYDRGTEEIIFPPRRQRRHIVLPNLTAKGYKVASQPASRPTSKTLNITIEKREENEEEEKMLWIMAYKRARFIFTELGTLWKTFQKSLCYSYRVTTLDL